MSLTKSNFREKVYVLSQSSRLPSIIVSVVSKNVPHRLRCFNILSPVGGDGWLVRRQCVTKGGLRGFKSHMPLSELRFTLSAFLLVVQVVN